jgi:hypothetical protein
MDGRRQARLLAVLIAATLAIMTSSVSAQRGSFEVQAGVTTFEETGRLTLDLVYSSATVAPAWVSKHIKAPGAKGSVGKGSVTFETQKETLSFDTSSSTSVYDLARQINASKSDARAAVMSTGSSQRLVVVAASNTAPTAFEDTGTIHIPGGVVAFEDTGTIHITGGFGAVSFGQRLTSAPVSSATKPGSVGKGTLWMSVGSASVAVDVSTKMSLNDVSAAINKQRSAFKAQVVRSKAGYSLVIDASNPAVADLFAFEDTGTIHLPGGVIAFEDTGTIHISGGLFSFEDTGTIHIEAFEDTGTIHSEGGVVFFEDTGTIHMPGGFFSFEDTGTIHMPGAMFSFEDTGTIHIELDTKLMF